MSGTMTANVKRQTSGNMYEAHRQWASRPADQCFPDVASLHEFCQAVRDRSYTQSVNLRKLGVEVDTENNDVALVVNDEPTHFTNFSFKQFCSFVGAPAEYLGGLSPQLVAENLNFGIRANMERKDAKMLLYESDNGDKFTRAATSQIYDRLWNADITEFLASLNPKIVHPPHSKNTNGGGTGLYASDHDMFAFMIADTDAMPVVKLDVPGADLTRGFYISNNEVGTGSFKVCMFACDYICGNHIIWNVKDSITISVRHVGNNANAVFTEVVPQAVAMAFVPKLAQEQELKLRAAQMHMLGTGREDVVQWMFEKRYATKKLAESSYDYAVQRHDEYGHCDPNSVWGMVAGLTANARDVAYYDQREIIEQSAAKLLDVVEV